MNFINRLKSINSPLIVSKRENIHYLTGLNQLHPVNREALLFINSGRYLLYHSPFLSPPQYPWLETLPMTPANSLKTALSSVFSTISHQPLAITFEAHNLTFAEYTKIHQALPDLKLEPTTDLIESLRIHKDPDEVKLISKACAITRRTMSWITDYLIYRLTDKPVTELSLAHLIEQKLYDFGADGLAFPPIVAFGPHSALPHHQPDKTKLKPGTVVLLDFGATYHGYCADMSRTIFYGSPPPPRFLQIETIVQAAYTAGIDLLRQHFTVTELTSKIHQPSTINHQPSPLAAASLDHAARIVIDHAGFGQNFIHTTGHALGLEIHEQPSLNSSNPTPLSPGMVITLEPGIYLPAGRHGLPGQFGYRHENTISLT